MRKVLIGLALFFVIMISGGLGVVVGFRTGVYTTKELIQEDLNAIGVAADSLKQSSSRAALKQEKLGRSILVLYAFSVIRDFVLTKGFLPDDHDIAVINRHQAEQAELGSPVTLVMTDASGTAPEGIDVKGTIGYYPDIPRRRALFFVYAYNPDGTPQIADTDTLRFEL